MRLGDRRRIRGVSFVELLIASLIIAVAVVGLFSLWTTATLQIRNSGLETMAGNIARADLENARVQGWAYLQRPASNGVSWINVTISGETLRAAQWSAPRRFFNAQGQAVAAMSASPRYAVDRVVTDVGAMAATGNTPYKLSPTSRRIVRTTVTLLPNNVVLTTQGTMLARGGL